MKHRYFVGSVLALALASVGCSNRTESARPGGATTGASRLVTTPRQVTRHAVLSSARVAVVSPGARVVADVELPVRADGPARVKDHASGMTAAFALVAATAASGVESDGVVTYRRGGPEGSDVVHVPGPAGTEDYVVFERRPAVESLAYTVDVSRAAGLRFVDGTLELMDAAGAPRVRMSAPFALDRRGARHAARVTLADCAADRDPSAPWGRPVTSPGRSECTVRIDFGASALEYPVVVDPAWTATANTMATPRAHHTATLLENGKVLVVGGVTAGAAGTHLDSAELFDPVTRTFAATGSMTGPRAAHVAVRLDSGDVFVALGTDNLGGPKGSAEVYLAATGVFADGGATTPRGFARAALLPDKRVLVTGGVGLDDRVVDDATYWDATTRRFGPGPAMRAKRTGHVMVALPTQTVVAGGAVSLALGDDASGEYLGSGGAAWRDLGSLSTARRDLAGVALHRVPARVLVTGGYDSVTKRALDVSQHLTEAQAAWSSPVKLGQARFHHTLTALPGGHALVVGGLTDSTDPASALASVELYDGGDDAYVTTAPLTTARYLHTATLLEDGRVLVTGGYGATGPVKSAELYAPAAKGTACERSAECATGFCVEGVCCDTACDDACSACTLASTGKPNGTCDLALAGTDPHGDCADDGSPACTRNGLCDGKGACASYAAKPCAPLPCTEDEECASEHCVDGICCSAACDGECEACTEAKTGESDGTCAPVAKGTDPDAECGVIGAGACRGPSICGGESECRASTAGKDCKAAECRDAVTLAAAATCSAGGECEAETTSCDPYTCDAGAVACRTECEDDAECAEGALCKDGECVRKPDGEPCDVGNECTSGFCADGVCCDVACDGQCEACDVQGKAVGVCSAVTGEPRGDREPCKGEAPCAGRCNGALRDACSYPSSDVTCGESSCEDGKETRDACNGRGVCVAGLTRDCLPFVCGDEACKTSCERDSDCADDLVCNDGRCTTAVVPGACSDGGTGAGCAPPASDDGGCGCRTAPKAETSEGRRSAGVLSLLALSLVARRAYRRRKLESPTS